MPIGASGRGSNVTNPAKRSPTTSGTGPPNEAARARDIAAGHIDQHQTAHGITDGLGVNPIRRVDTVPNIVALA